MNLELCMGAKVEPMRFLCRSRPSCHVLSRPFNPIVERSNGTKIITESRILQYPRFVQLNRCFDQSDYPGVQTLSLGIQHQFMVFSKY